MPFLVLLTAVNVSCGDKPGSHNFLQEFATIQVSGHYYLRIVIVWICLTIITKA